MGSHGKQKCHDLISICHLCYLNAESSEFGLTTALPLLTSHTGRHGRLQFSTGHNCTSELPCGPSTSHSVTMMLWLQLMASSLSCALLNLKVLHLLPVIPRVMWPQHTLGQSTCGDKDFPKVIIWAFLLRQKDSQECQFIWDVPPGFVWELMVAVNSQFLPYGTSVLNNNQTQGHKKVWTACTMLICEQAKAETRQAYQQQQN